MRDRGKPSAFVSDVARPYDRVETNASPCSGMGLCTESQVTPGLGAEM